MLQIPELNDADIALGSIKHMPKYETVPAEFKNSGNPYVRFISNWFFRGVDITHLTPQDGVDKTKALRAIKAVIGSFAPKHEHKMAACAYMLSEWFDLEK